MDNKVNESNTEVINENGIKTKLTFDDQVVKKIAGIAVSEIPGILGLSGNAISNLTDRFTNGNNPTKGISAEVGTKQVAIDLDVIGEYGKNIAQVFDTATKKVADEVKNMTGLDVIEFNMNVDDVMTKEQYDEKFEGKKKEPAEENNQSETNSRTLA
ncbi:Asp23/Gls24 family envelope stress response protein [Enterococcus wangshanyuanii]|uniref:Stress response regulator gls24 homolog n=1 Tax=Enterococcus wangshanyuanii TaxID=2005703 RepID=A0ABQ1P8R1_9ENTE|nr:Asp23/Gls24 family envelope stress response protein [Enterococcus wangshanyuanii]GGC93039.1 alkaline shock protein 23 [Enterococcus wangshanyuanii]